MKFLLDHDVADEIAGFLTKLGHETQRLRDVLNTASTDAEVLAYARSSDSILITCNRDDFITLAREQSHEGIILLIRRRTHAHERAALLHLIQSAGESGIAGNINFA